ncbi:acyl-CoA dehydrogenase family protein [Kineosporia succinea]|uniref:Alkylation response protein AidB-like acyl-CoA dehydrogenase n=1 Tax=Kineosporia succinea TaxID=84632 RepID=A0ABT9P6V2_9ACTN|nr:acyl-CoA dehydrogenase family protein [Kineosporia succinea]MDP9828416.1 alkylation response protein AidB-like acyl-CoA dehydrogenase [Kineosporia succinea]
MTATVAPRALAPEPGRFQDFCAGDLAWAPPADGDTVYDEAHPLWQRFTAAGLANWWLPTRYGGRGLTLGESLEPVAELAYHCPGFAFTAALSILGSRMLELYGNPLVAESFLTEMARDGSFCATLGSETGAGSELARTETTFRRQGERIVLNGSKAFSTNLAAARYYLVLARNETNDKEFAVVLVPAGTPGLTIGPRWRMSGLQGTATSPATLENCSVPAIYSLRGNGLRVLEVGLNGSRILMSAIAVGIARRVRDLGMDYARAKEVAGRPLLQHPVFAARMGQLEADLESMKSVCQRAASDYDALAASSAPAAAFYRHGVIKSAIMAKMHCGQTGWRLVSTASEGFGGLGYTESHPVQRCLRDIRHVSIVEGGDDVLRELMYSRYVKRSSQRG